MIVSPKNNSSNLHLKEVHFKRDDCEYYQRGDGKYFDRFAIVDNYLILKEARALDVFELDIGKEEAQFVESFRLDKEELDTIDAIDKQNIFLIFHTSSVQRLDMVNRELLDVKFFNEKNPLIAVSSVYFNEKCRIKSSEGDFFFGLIANSSRLFLSKSAGIFDDSLFKIQCEYIKDFKEKIEHIEFKIFYPNGITGEGGYCLITVLTKERGQYALINISPDNEYQAIKDQLDKVNWYDLYQMEDEAPIMNIFQSYYYDSNINNPISFIAITDSLKMVYCTFSTDYEDPEHLVTNEIFELSKQIKGVDRGDLIGIHHYNTTAYLSFKKRIDLYDLTSKTIQAGTTYKDNSMQSKVYDPSLPNDKKNFYYLFFLFNLHLKYEKIFTNYDDNKFIRDTANFNIVSNVQRRDNVIYIEGKCAFCGFKCYKRCSACKKAYYCHEDHQEKHWNLHRSDCIWKGDIDQEGEIKVKLEKEVNINFQSSLNTSNIEEYKSEWEDQRKKILLLLQNPQTYPEAIDQCYRMIQDNRERIYKRLQEHALINLKVRQEKYSKDYKKLIHSYKFYEDYLCNIMLLIHAFMLKQNLTEAWRVLNKVIKELEERGIANFIEIFCDFLVKNSISEHEVKYESPYKQEIEGIYLRYLQLLCSIGKIGYSLGEFSTYEKYMLDYVEKIQRVFSEAHNRGFILSNIYLLLGNLYVELDSIGKAMILYDACITIYNTSPIKDNLYDVAICAYYNLGILYFVTDQYHNSKTRLESALKIKKELKMEKNDADTIKISETLGEIEIEYRNFSSAYTYLQNAINARLNSPLPDDRQRKLTIAILLDHIEQNLDNEKKMTNKTSANLLQNGLYMPKDEAEFENLMMYVRGGLDEPRLKKEEKGKRAQNKDVDVDELEKFFLFMTKLSAYQIEVLNKTQPVDKEKNKNMPVYFSAEFKSCLNHHQRLELCDLKIMSLRRINVLKDYTKKIDLENLNYYALHTKHTQNNLSSIKNYFFAKNILKKWECDKNKTGIPQFSRPIRGSMYRGSSLKSSDITSTPIANKVKDDGKTDNTSQMKTPQNNLDNKFSEVIHKEDVDFDKFKNIIMDYCKTVDTPKQKLIDEKLLFTISQALANEDLKLLVENPDLIFDVIEAYQAGDFEVSQKAEQEVIDDSQAYDEKLEFDNSKEDLNVSNDSDHKVHGGIPPVPGNKNARINAMAKNTID